MSGWLPEPSPRTLIPPNRDHPFFNFATDLPFDPEGTAYSPANAAWFADLALLAYDDPPHVARALQRVDFKLSGRQPVVAESSGGAAQAYVAHDDHNVWVVFRGTEIPVHSSTRGFLRKSLDAINDTLANVRLAMTPFDDLGLAHTGFAGALDEVWSRLFDGWLAPLALGEVPRRVWFTGHSLGAATAALAALRFGSPAGLYTFGAPRIGDAALARAAAALPAWRVVLRDDVITRVPPAASGRIDWIPDGYCHLGAACHVDEAGLLRHEPPAAEELAEGIIEFVANVSSPIESLSRGFGAFPELGGFIDSVLSGEASRDARRFARTVYDHAPLYYALTMRHLAGVAAGP